MSTSRILRPARRLAALALAAVPAAAQANLYSVAETDKLVGPDSAPFDFYGIAVDLSGDRLAVGASLHDVSHGAVYLYERNGGGPFAFHTKLSGLDANAGADEFGWRLALDGDTVAVGAHKDNDFGTFSGSVYVHRRGSSGWSQEAELHASNAATWERFGESVALEGDLLAVTALQSNGFNPNPGRVYVFRRQGTTWTEEAILAPSGLGANDQFGIGLAVSGGRIAIGANAHDGGASNAGAVWVYSQVAGVWTVEAMLQPDDSHANLLFGAGVALDGDRLVAGAVGDSTFGANAGAAYVFDRVGGTWSQTAKLLPADGAAGDAFGLAVAVGGERVLVGARTDDTRTGSAYLFVECAGTFAQADKVYASDAEPNSLFGVSVALDGDDVAIGASEDGQGPPPNQDVGPGAVYTHRIALDPSHGVYCTAKPNSLGCVPALDAAGTPSLSQPVPFTITAIQVLSQQNGVFFLGVGPRAAIAFGGGTLCFAPPLKRTQVLDSGGPPPPSCNGAYSFDLNAWLQSSANTLVGVGDTVRGQFWTRDPQDPFGIGLTQAIEVMVCQ